MKFSTLFPLGLPALAIAQTAPSSADPIVNFVQVANETVSKLSIFGCHVRPCLLALAPSLVICAAAAAQEELDPINDAACFAAAAKAIHSKVSQS
ncbi:hypothetical protein M409DRAFT_21592 [Zasmidium cellare ATCC 36951]|uniref:Fungal calcium binding protein domain-containing protein n=1 Tax=Zasmidium cellare ATCC 36951 TaxID=1080233 RepID=A0A6A6CLL4_ZASCE|nr:uncharacterized protein M409DRAFT_21592 [Zasmidium cellare ATCC 36951]KAF2168147.1 hypothetical protein M409DRAFT_21592 [Zasmidium cellare ATCC 36951]